MDGRHRNVRVMAFVWVVAVVLSIASCTSRSTPTLDIATTTSVQNSGLLNAVLPHFQDATVRVHAAGSGRALQMLADGTVALVISHAPDAEARYLREHSAWQYRKLAFNRFTIVGPGNDPANVKNASSAADAFLRIATAKASFISRGDSSGTHEREQMLWRSAGIPQQDAPILVSGRSMSLALRHADERQAYTLTDQATFWQMQETLQLLELYGGDAMLLNTYALVFPTGNAIAERFAQWLADGDGRERIASFTIDGRPAFTVWPSGCAGATPDAQPCGAP